MDRRPYDPPLYDSQSARGTLYATLARFRVLAELQGVLKTQREVPLARSDVTRLFSAFLLNVVCKQRQNAQSSTSLPSSLQLHVTGQQSTHLVVNPLIFFLPHAPGSAYSRRSHLKKETKKKRCTDLITMDTR